MRRGRADGKGAAARHCMCVWQAGAWDPAAACTRAAVDSPAKSVSSAMTAIQMPITHL